MDRISQIFLFGFIGFIAAQAFTMSIKVGDIRRQVADLQQQCSGRK